MILFNGKENASNLLEEFFKHVKNKGLIEQTNFALPFQNSISQYEEIDYPGDWDLEERLGTISGGMRILS